MAAPATACIMVARDALESLVRHQPIEDDAVSDSSHSLLLTTDLDNAAERSLGDGPGSNVGPPLWLLRELQNRFEGVVSSQVADIDLDERSSGVNDHGSVRLPNPRDLRQGRGEIGDQGEHVGNVISPRGRISDSSAKVQPSVWKDTDSRPAIAALLFRFTPRLERIRSN